MEKPDGCTYPNCFICPLADCSWASAKAELPGETKKKRRIVRRSKKERCSEVLCDNAIKKLRRDL